MLPYMRMADIANIINIQPDVLGGKPVIKGTRVPVALVIEEMAGGTTIEEVMKEYELTRAQALGALRYAAIKKLDVDSLPGSIVVIAPGTLRIHRQVGK